MSVCLCACERVHVCEPSAPFRFPSFAFSPVSADDHCRDNTPDSKKTRYNSRMRQSQRDCAFLFSSFLFLRLVKARGIVASRNPLPPMNMEMNDRPPSSLLASRPSSSPPSTPPCSSFFRAFARDPRRGVRSSRVTARHANVVPRLFPVRVFAATRRRRGFSC